MTSSAGRKRSPEWIASLAFAVLLAAAFVFKILSVTLRNDGEALAAALMETAHPAFLGAGIAVAVVSLSRNVYLAASRRRAALRRMFPEAVVFATFNRIRRRGDTDLLQAWRPAGRWSLTLGATVDAQGWHLWRGFFRPRKVLSIEAARIAAVEVRKDIGGVPGITVTVVNPDDEYNFSLISERPSGFRATESTLAAEIVELIVRRGSQSVV